MRQTIPLKKIHYEIFFRSGDYQNLINIICQNLFLLNQLKLLCDKISLLLSGNSFDELQRAWRRGFLSLMIDWIKSLSQYHFFFNFQFSKQFIYQSRLWVSLNKTLNRMNINNQMDNEDIPPVSSPICYQLCCN